MHRALTIRFRVFVFHHATPPVPGTFRSARYAASTRVWRFFHSAMARVCAAETTCCLTGKPPRLGKPGVGAMCHSRFSRSPRDPQSSAVSSDVADLGHDLDGDQGRARGRAADLLRRGALHPGLGGAAGRGARRAWRCSPAGAPGASSSAACWSMSATYALLYWGMQFVASGVAGVVNMSMNPVFLFGFAILFGQERAGLAPSASRSSLGIAGLVILFSGKASFRRHRHRAVGRGRDRRRLALLFARLGAVASAARAGHAAPTDRRAGRGRARSA